MNMKNSMKPSAQQPMIVKFVETLHTGIRSQALSRCAIGYVLRGTKYIYDGDKRETLTRGNVFYLGIGLHYTENVPENGQPFEQLLFYYSPGELQHILMHLNITYGLNISNDHSCDRCRNRTHVACRPGARCAASSSTRTTTCATRSSAATRQPRASR